MELRDFRLRVYLIHLHTIKARARCFGHKCNTLYIWGNRVIGALYVWGNKVFSTMLILQIKVVPLTFLSFQILENALLSSLTGNMLK